jgi:pimeloyl-ACP methyl ester carboxylesterase
MAFVENQGAKLYWDEQGRGETVLLIMGLGYPSCLWNRTRPVLSQHYRTVAFDNRGVGLSDVPPGPYPIATMASDAAAVLDAAEVSSAHIFGVSMGGMIAQEFALKYPARTQSLILGCTSPGGPSAVRAERKVSDILMVRGMSLEQAREAILPYIYDAATPPEKIDEDVRLRRRWLPSLEGYTAQLQGILAWESYGRIAQITAPTLVHPWEVGCSRATRKWGIDRGADSRCKARPTRSCQSSVSHRPDPGSSQGNIGIYFVPCG